MEWEEWIEVEEALPYMQLLNNFLKQETFFPPKEKIFNAFTYTPWKETKVVILGQDPYHGEGQAEGLSFSVPKGEKIPPSLVNIFRELQTDMQIEKPTHGSLVHWAKQGVLLLNSILTVRPGEPKSHANRGWEVFTQKAIRRLFAKKEPLVFLLWGKTAIEAYPFLKNPSHHLILTAPHPSPFSAHLGFLGCHHFSQTNKFLKMHNLQEIDWVIPP